MAKQFNTAVEKASANSPRSAALLKLSGLSSDATDAPHFEETDGVLDLLVSERILRWHAEAIGRCLDLSLSADM